MHAIILSIGDELVLGQSIDTNSAFLSAKLAELGLMTLYHQTIADDQAAIARAITQACAQAELVLITGGLGPTQDDLTRQALADALGTSLLLDESALKDVEAFFVRRNRPMPATNRIQAMYPQGTRLIPNSAGTAPGITGKLGRATFYVTPGVPREMVVMFEKSILPQLRDTCATRSPILTAKINTFGSGESTIGEILGKLMDRQRNPKVGTTVANGIVSVRIRSEFPTLDESRQQLDETSAQVCQLLGPLVYGSEEETLQQSIFALLKERKLTLATAESCTGGLIARFLTDVPGSSDVFVGGWVVYSNALKTSTLGVPPEVLQQHGAVSRETATVLAQGALQRSGADLAISVTGIAGPDGGSPDKPVGTVWIGWCYRPQLAKVSQSGALQAVLSGNRETIRDRAAKTALQLLRFHLLGQDVELIQWLAK